MAKATGLQELSTGWRTVSKTQVGGTPVGQPSIAKAEPTGYRPLGTGPIDPWKFAYQGPSVDPFPRVGGPGQAGGGIGGFMGRTPRALTMLAQRRQEGLSPALQRLRKGLLEGIVGTTGKLYGEARGAAASRYDELMRALAQTTTQREADIRASYAQKEADIGQRLTRLGMTGTTISPTMQLGVEREQAESLNRLADVMLQQRLGIIGRQQELETQLPQARGTQLMQLAGLFSGLR